MSDLKKICLSGYRFLFFFINQSSKVYFQKKFENLCLKLAIIMRMKRFKITPANSKPDPISFEKQSTQAEFLPKTFQDDTSSKRLDNIEALFKAFLKRENERGELEEQELKFKYAAIVMDRFFFYVSIFYSIVTFIGLILSMPNFYSTD